MRTNSKMIILIILMLAFTSCRATKSVAWADSIENPENAEYVNEVAFNLDIPAEKVTQKQFNERYVK